MQSLIESFGWVHVLLESFTSTFSIIFETQIQVMLTQSTSHSHMYTGHDVNLVMRNIAFIQLSILQTRNPYFEE